MTTRKALIEKIQSMQLGTQEMLDAAKYDATLIPFDTLFVDTSGNVRWRIPNDLDDYGSVAMAASGADWEYREALQLCPIAEE